MISQTEGKLLRIIGIFCCAIGNKESSDNIKNMHKKGSYPYVPYAPVRFFKLIQKVKKMMLKNNPKKFDDFNLPTFMDYGCGIGCTLAIANIFHFEVHGIEINKYFLIASLFPLIRG